MGRTKINFETIVSRHPEGTIDQIAAVLEEGERQADFMRMAVERELKRRERRS